MSTLNEVKSLQAMGFALLWLYPKSKRPIGEAWTEGPAQSWDVLAKTFNKTNNVGVRLGTPSRFKDGSYLCVLDCDVKSSNPIHLKEMELALNSFCPANEFAPRVLSGRGGGSCHIYFRTKKPQQSFKALRSGHKVKVYMPSVDASAADKKELSEQEINEGYRLRLAWEIDVFGEGKQVVIPPSTHPDTGKRYEWEYPLTSYDIIPLHENFSPKKTKLTSKSNPSKVVLEDVNLFETPVTDEAFKLIFSGEGMEKFPSRSEALFSSIGALVRAGLSDGQICKILTDPENFMSEKAIEAGKNNLDASSRWLKNQIDKIRMDLLEKTQFEDQAIVDDLDEIIALSDDEAAAQQDELVSWQTQLKGAKNGLWKNTAHNIYLIMKNLSGETNRAQSVFAYDEFNQANVYTFAPPWGDASDVGRELTDLDDIRIKTWLSQEWGIEASIETVANTAYMLGKENPFHPVRRYLEGLKWDGKQRLCGMLEKYCGAVDDKAYLADVGKKFMTAAVARVMRPGVKFDYVVILEGGQGIGKSTFVQTLSAPWDSDSLGDITSKDVVDNMRGKWIIELGELASMNRAEANDLKAFVTRQHDVTRKAYGRRAQTYSRQCIFVGTTNDDEYLKDSTGGRRYWPVRTTKFNIHALKKDKDQLWAEALHLYQQGEKLFLDDDEVRSYAEGEQKDRFIVDEIQNTVKRIVDSEDVPEEFTFDDVWNGMNRLEGRLAPRVCDYVTQQRIKKALRVLGYPKARKRVDGSRSYVWFKDVKKMVNKYKDTQLKIY